MVPHITISQETPSSKETDSALPVLQSLSEGGSPVEEKGESKTAPTEITETVERPAEQSIKPEETTATQETTAPQAIPQEVPMIPYEGTLSDETMHEIAANELPTTTEAVEATEGVAPSSEKTSEEVSVIEPSQPVIPTMPEPVKEEPITIPEEETQEAPAGIDTVSLENPQGNWLYKRIWWERAEERYEKIRNLVDTVWGSRIIFFDKRNELDRNVFDPFYLNVGIGQGELQTILTELVDFFEKHREQHGDLNEQERSLYDTIATEEEALKQLKQDVESVANLDHEIDNALGTLMNQINRVRQYERQAWENFKEIAHILNDTKARELYYMIEGAARNIKNINTYIEQDFFNHFAKLVGEATKHVNRVQNQIESLKEKGVSFKRQAELLEQKQEQPAEEEEEEVAPKPKLSWFGWIMSGVNSVSSFIFSIIRMPYDMIFGK
jgi:uncharacterized phage infection (PIP) family protein YhgE